MHTELRPSDFSQFRGRAAYEHFHRYTLCCDGIAGKNVLDLSCGLGQGSTLLARAGGHVTGVDIDLQTIREAKARQAGRTGKARQGADVKFVVADLYDLPFADGMFDVVVANDITGNAGSREGLIREACRVLADDGVLFISVPDKATASRADGLGVDEFRRLLSGHFAEVRLIGMRMALVSAAYELNGPSKNKNMASADLYRMSLGKKKGPAVSGDDLWLENGKYIFAACSHRPIESAASRSSILYSREDDLLAEYENLSANNSHADEERDALRMALAEAREDLSHALKDRGALAERLDDLAGLKTSMGEVLNLQKADVNSELALVSRLLGKVTGNDVPANADAMVESLFDLNETLTSLRGRIGDADRMRIDHEGLQAKATDLQRALDQALGDVARIRAERDEVEKEAARLKAAAPVALAPVVPASVLSAPVAVASAIQVAAPQPHVNTGNARNRERFNMAHRRVRTALERAPQAIQGRLSGQQNPPPARGKKWRNSLGFPVDPFHTAIFDPSWIAGQLPEMKRIRLGRFLSDPALRDIDPHPLFASARYLADNHDVMVSGMSPLEHYVRNGWREGRNPHPLFSNDWYLEQNPDVLASGKINPLDHYLQFGWHEGRWPNPVFDPRAYLDRYLDVAEAGIEPLTHYVTYGQAEERDLPSRNIDPEWRLFLPSGAKTPQRLVEHLLYAEPVADIAPATPDAVAPAPVALPPVQAEPGPVAAATEQAWPPQPLNDYWPPQTLRDFVIDGYGEEAIDLYWYLYSVMDAYVDKQEDFAASAVCAQLVERARLRAQRVLPPGLKPDASIIVPVYNNILDTLLCVVSVLESAPERSYEIIVADDGSTDATPQVISAIGGAVRYLRQPKNYGFLGNCNEAAQHANGHHIILLNNDTLVMPNWLDALLSPFFDFDNIGLTGSKLINWDGSLQEAGGIFWKDGSAWNFGRGQDPRAPEFNYVKDTDYCSGAAIAIPTAIWRDIDGFDPAYTPAYCEDSDIAFRLRDTGYRTLYCPGAEVIHHEGRSHGRDLSSGIKAYQTANQQRLLERWLHVLERDHYPNAHNVLRARDRSFGKRHILIVDHYVPQFDRDAGSRTIFDFIHTLINDGWSVTFWPDNLWRDPNYTPHLQKLGVEVIFGVKYRNEFEAFLREREGLYDAVLLSRPHIAKDYVSAVGALTSAKLVYYGHDIHFRRMEAQAKLEGKEENTSQILDMKNLELSICNSSNVVIYPSQDEASVMSALVSSGVRVEAIPAYCYDEVHLQAAEVRIANRAAPSTRLKLLFVGGFRHQPNIDGIVWFCETVVPLLRAANIGFDLKVVGSNANETIMALATNDIDVLGFVSDETLEALYRETDIVIAPLRYGAGVKGKVVEAVAHGVPVVTTDIGAQGIDAEGAFLFIGNEPDDFVRGIRRASDVDTARDRTTKAVRFIRRYYSQDAMKRMFQSLLD